tara:strand:- start:37 stop:306 length:270 start_codon:yes stop_codon:yes gene_type:complete
MGLTKEQKLEKYDIGVDYKDITLLETVSIKDDGKVVSASSTHRILCPGDDVSSESDEIKSLAEFLWTDEVKKAWEEHMKKINEGLSDNA